MCTASEILAQIDDQGPNWTFLTFRVKKDLLNDLESDSTPFIFKTGLVLQ